MFFHPKGQLSVLPLPLDIAAIFINGHSIQINFYIFYVFSTHDIIFMG